ncbi:hypothetical protein, partial [Oceanicoccus sp.]|uniref:hypothetical protein n=1 Tax=Oceanicoccus sp. TaxID=2691044 RepID=UPI0026272CA0
MFFILPSPHTSTIPVWPLLVFRLAPHARMHSMLKSYVRICSHYARFRIAHRATIPHPVQTHPIGIKAMYALSRCYIQYVSLSVVFVVGFGCS